jgi:hypothetical protein
VSRTTQELATNVLERLKVIAAGDVPEDADAQSVKTFYSGTFKETAAIDDLPYWDEDDIPDEAFEALTDFVAGRMAPNFGEARPDLEQSGETRLRRLSAKGATGRRVTAAFF